MLKDDVLHKCIVSISMLFWAVRLEVIGLGLWANPVLLENSEKMHTDVLCAAVQDLNEHQSSIF